jgi:cephalosporin hydroxylase
MMSVLVMVRSARPYAHTIELRAQTALCTVASFFIRVVDLSGAEQDVSVAIGTDDSAAVLANNIVEAYSIMPEHQEQAMLQIETALKQALQACVQGTLGDMHGHACRKRQCAPKATDPLTRWFDAHERGYGISKWRHYLPAYHRHLQKFRGRSPTVLEIGVQNGGSPGMWQEYFGEGTTVHGVDINPDCGRFERAASGVHIHIGDQGDPAFLQRLAEAVGKVDIVIDDGGHTMQQQILTLQALFPSVKPGGVFLVEDTHTSYYEGQAFGGGLRRNGTFVEYSKGLVDELHGFRVQRNGIPVQPNAATTAFTLEAESMHYYESMLFIEKRGRPLDPRATWGGLTNEKRGDVFLDGFECWWAGVHHCERHADRQPPPALAELG